MQTSREPVLEEGGHCHFPGGHKLAQPQTGLAVTKVVTTAAACETTYASRSWVHGESDSVSQPRVHFCFPSLFDPGFLP